METAIVHLKVDRKKINTVANQLAEMDGITEVYSISGPFDLIAIIRVNNTDMIADIVTKDLLKIEGILDSETSIAFRCYSKHDLDSMFSVGFE
ncbi:MAG TPA: Lrp/AsnC ligand binding domain-containing protein [bacterium]|nr:Lrp/AsnC ligand binding domain-containing protein [bacterium]